MPLYSKKKYIKRTKWTLEDERKLYNIISIRLLQFHNKTEMAIALSYEHSLRCSVDPGLLNSKMKEALSRVKISI